MDEKGCKSSYHHGDLKNALIQAGVEILAHQGIGELSLRKVAQRAGVSHSAPYAHFKDKQALIAAICIEGFNKLLNALESTFEKYSKDPHQLLVETAFTYAEFALKEEDTFKVMFSGVLEKEKDYPELVDVIQRTFQMVVKVVSLCQSQEILPLGDVELTATTLWAQIYGLISLFLEGQISHTILEQHELKELLIYALDRYTLFPYNELDG